MFLSYCNPWRLAAKWLVPYTVFVNWLFLLLCFVLYLSLLNCILFQCPFFNFSLLILIMFANVFTVLPSSLLNADLISMHFILLSKVLMKILNEPDPGQTSVKPHSVILSFWHWDTDQESEKSRPERTSGNHLMLCCKQDLRLGIYGCLKPGLHYFQWGRFYHFCQLPIPMFNSSYKGEFFSYIQLEFLLKKLVPVTFFILSLCIPVKRVSLCFL